MWGDGSGGQGAELPLRQMDQGSVRLRLVRIGKFLKSAKTTGTPIVHQIVMLNLQLSIATRF